MRLPDDATDIRVKPMGSVSWSSESGDEAVDEAVDREAIAELVSALLDEAREGIRLMALFYDSAPLLRGERDLGEIVDLVDDLMEVE